MRKLCRVLIPLLLFSSCNRGSESDARLSAVPGESETGYARGFEVTKMAGYNLVKVFDPWQNSRDVTLSYILTVNTRQVPDSLQGQSVIEVPVHRVVTLSTTHVAMIDQLGKSETIKGMSGTKFVYNPGIRDKIERGEVVEVGYEQGLNYETIVNLDPDVLFIYGVETNMRGISEKLADLGIPVVFCGEYLEPHPLGKAEWIKFFALFYGCEQMADTIFHKTESNYQSLVSLAANTTGKPRVLTGLPWKDTWYMAGGKSFAAKLIHDAGGDYLWSDNPSDEAVPLDLESVYVKAVNADIWINPGVALNLGQLAQFDERFLDLPVLLKGEVYNNDNRLGPDGGNDYWESGTVRPDLVLADLIKVFHPDLLVDHPYIYYRKLK
jgi:iron complex transport system substrate-binding protein